MGDSRLFRITSMELPTCVTGVLVDQPQWALILSLLLVRDVILSQISVVKL